MKKSFRPPKLLWFVLAALALFAFQTPRRFTANFSLAIGHGAVRTAGFFSRTQEFFRNKSALVLENGELKRLAEERKIRADFLEAELAEFKKTSGAEKNSAGIIARVLSQSPIMPYDALLIFGGARTGLKAGMEALAYDSILLGEIDEVFNANSRIRLLSYPGRKTEAFLESSSLNIILEGMGGLNLKFSVPKTIDIKVGEKIVSNPPPSYLIGQVEEIRAKESEPLAEVLVKIPANLRYLRYVTLVNPP